MLGDGASVFWKRLHHKNTRVLTFYTTRVFIFIFLDFICFILLKDIFLLLYYYFASFFGFKRGYGMAERSNFILTEIKRCYNTNDRWKFILFLIRRENDLNK